MKVNNPIYRGCACGRCSGAPMPVSGSKGNTAAPYSQNTADVSAFPPAPTNVATAPTAAASQVSAENFQEMLSNLIGNYIITELLIGIDRLVLRQGYLTAVGPSYYILYDPEPNVNTVCDIYSLKFVSYFESGERPTTAEFDRWLESLRQDTYVFNSTTQ